MFVITLKVDPKSGTEQADEAGGAYAVCWLDFQLQDGAEHLAKFYVEQGGWRPIGIKKVVTVDEEYYDTEYEAEERRIKAELHASWRMVDSKLRVKLY